MSQKSSKDTVRCHSGHETNPALWDCPVCVEKRIAALETRLETAIELTPAEIQSKLDRVRWAEMLIKQLPEKHDGRNSWLLNYGTDAALGEVDDAPT